MIGCIYNCNIECKSIVFRISSQLTLCWETIIGEDMLEKNILHLSRPECAHRATISRKCFWKYFTFISCLLVAEQNNKQLMKNYDSRLTGSTPSFEVNVTINNLVCGRDRGRGCCRRRNNYRNCCSYSNHSSNKKKCILQKWDKG